MTTSNGHALAAALGYAARGWRVVPVTGKRPSCGNAWDRQATNDPCQVERLFRLNAHDGAGVHLGETSGIVDVECDDDNAEQTLLELFSGTIPTTPTFQSTRGKHRIFRWTPELPEPTKAVFKIGQLEFRTGNGSKAAQTVFPPSNGRTWIVSPDDVALAEIPAAVIQRIKARSAKPKAPPVIAATSHGTAAQGGGVDVRDRARQYLAHIPPAVSGQQGHRQTFLAAQHLVRGFELNDSEAFDLLAEWNQHCAPPWSDHELRHKITSARSDGDTVEVGEHLRQSSARPMNGSAKKRSRQETPTAADDHDDSRLSIRSKEGQTDIANARRLVKLHGDKLRYCHPWRQWLVWDDTRWARDNSGHITQLAKSVADGIWQEARTAGADDALRFAAQSASERSINAMLSLAKSEPGIPIQPSDLDRDSLLLNVISGTIDLKTGTHRAHAPADLLTKLAPIEYDPQAAWEEWDRFLGRIFADDAELIGYMQRLAGYWLTGVIREQALPIFWGVGANGKTTFLNAIMDVLGSDYAMKATSDFLMVKRGDSHPTDKADLFGKRLVVASETEENRRLAESLVKELTGSERIRARRLYEDFWEFSPTHKLVLCTNHKPIIRGTDHAIWRRLRLVPFSVVIPDDQQDKTLSDKLRAEASGILNWCLAGCRAWQQHAEQPPKAVSAATQGYRVSQDVLQLFLDDCCLESPATKTKAGDIYDAYKVWSERSGEHAETQRQFGEAMTDHGFERKVSNGTWYIGVGLRSDHSADA